MPRRRHGIRRGSLTPAVEITFTRPASPPPPTMIRLTSDWIPLPEAHLRYLGWVEGEAVKIEVLEDDTVILTKATRTP